MRRIEIAPADNPVLECCDHSAACFIRIFEGNSLPKGWSGLKRIFFVHFNLIVLGLCIASDWIFFTCWPKLRTLMNRDHGRNTSDDDSIATEDIDRREAKIFDVIRIVYFSCLLGSVVLFGSTQCFIHLFALWRGTWRQTLALIVEMVALLVQTCASPVLISLLLFLTPIGSNRDEDSARINGVCGWQLLALSVTHAVSIFVWHWIKLVSLGLCCCTCFTCCLFTWPLYKACGCGDSSKDIEYASSARRHRTFAATVLNFMPPETDRGSWLAASKWCILTVWIFPITVATLTACGLMTAVVFMDRNFLYYPSWY